MTKNEAIKRVISLAKSEIGYRPYSGKRTKFADYLDGLGDVYNGKKSGFDWCDVFVDYIFIKTFGERDGMSMLYQEYKGLGAGCGYSANYFRKHGAFSKNPEKGSQIFYGQSGNEYHTGLVVDVDETYIYTVEGNIGGGNGQVGTKKVKKTDNSISGFGIPNWKIVEGVENKVKLFGIDISAWQGNYPLDKAQKEGARFCIVKGGGGDDGLYIDSKAERNYSNAKKLGLKVGAYWFSYAMNPEQARTEAEYFYQNFLKGKQFELPIYIDVENKTQLNIGKRGVTEVIKAWCEHLAAKDYWVGIYSSLSYFRNYMYDNELQKYCHWVAQWSTHLDYDCGLWQFGGETNYIRSNKVAGITTDQDYLLYDYEKDIKERGKNGFPKPKPKIGFTRIAGKDRYQTAIEVAKRQAYDTVILASGENFADGLSASYLAKIKKAPILLTNDTKMKDVCNFINGTAKTCYIIGGTGAVSSDAEKYLKIENERISGANRYDTNLELLKMTYNTDKLIVCTGKNFPDVISASASRLPIMIVGDKLTDAQIKWINKAKINQIYAVGGTLPVGALNILKKKAKVKQLIGSNRYETSRLVALEFNSKATKVIFVTGKTFPDGLVANRLTDAPVVLVDDNYFIDAQKVCAKIQPTKAYVIGGVLSDRTINWALSY